MKIYLNDASCWDKFYSPVFKCWSVRTQWIECNFLITVERFSHKIIMKDVIPNVYQKKSSWVYEHGLGQCIWFQKIFSLTIQGFENSCHTFAYKCRASILSIPDYLIPSANGFNFTFSMKYYQTISNLCTTIGKTFS